MVFSCLFSWKLIYPNKNFIPLIICSFLWDRQWGHMLSPRVVVSTSICCDFFCRMLHTRNGIINNKINKFDKKERRWRDACLWYKENKAREDDGQEENQPEGHDFSVDGPLGPFGSYEKAKPHLFILILNILFILVWPLILLVLQLHPPWL